MSHPKDRIAFLKLKRKTIASVHFLFASISIITVMHFGTTHLILTLCIIACALIETAVQQHMIQTINEEINALQKSLQQDLENRSPESIRHQIMTIFRTFTDEHEMEIDAESYNHLSDTISMFFPDTVSSKKISETEYHETVEPVLFFNFYLSIGKSNKKYPISAKDDEILKQEIHNMLIKQGRIAYDKQKHNIL